MTSIIITSTSTKFMRQSSSFIPILIAALIAIDKTTTVQATATACTSWSDCNYAGYCNKTSGLCKCRTNYVGQNCETFSPDSSSTSSSSSSHLLAINQTPAPAPLTTCKPGCVNGNCNGKGTCQCIAGFTGDSCDTAMGILTQNTGPGSLGSECLSAKDCGLVSNSYCEVYSGSCAATGGICLCKPGYVASAGACVMLQGLGDACGSTNQVCIGNTECSSAVTPRTCQCIANYTADSLSRKCIATVQMKAHNNDLCATSDECYNDLMCVNGRCACMPGRIADGLYWCRPIDFGDACLNDSTCANLTRAQCDGVSCKCRTGMALMTYTDPTGATKQTCASSIRLDKGDFCPTTHESVCPINYACIQCANTGQTGNAKCLLQGPFPTTTHTMAKTTAKIYSKSTSLTYDNNRQLMAISCLGLLMVALFAA